MYFIIFVKSLRLSGIDKPLTDNQNCYPIVQLTPKDMLLPKILIIPVGFVAEIFC